MLQSDSMSSFFSFVCLFSHILLRSIHVLCLSGSECEVARLSPDLHCCTAPSTFRTPSSITTYAFHHSVVSAAFCQYSNAFNRIIASISFLNKLLLSVQWKKDLKHKHAAHLLLLHWYQIKKIYLWLCTLGQKQKRCHILECWTFIWIIVNSSEFIYFKFLWF